MTLGHVRTLARTIQGRLCGFFYGYLDQLGSDSAHQRGTEGAVQVRVIRDRAGEAGANARCGEVARHICNLYGTAEGVP
jgi:hypothetical protein